MTQLPDLRRTLATDTAEALSWTAYPTVQQAVTLPSITVQTRDPSTSYRQLGGRYLEAIYHLGVVALVGRGEAAEAKLGELLDPDGPLVRALVKAGGVVLGASEMRTYVTGGGESLGLQFDVDMDG
jgi:hypothetical protein